MCKRIEFKKSKLTQSYPVNSRGGKNALEKQGRSTSLLYSWGSLDKNTGVCCHFLFPGDLPDPGIEPMSPAWRADFLPLSHQGSL